MHISWLGQTCIKLQTKNLNDDVIVLIDPYKPEKGTFPRSLAPQIAVLSKGRKNTITLSQDPFIIDSLGEIEVKNVMIYSYPAEKQSVFKINAEGLNIVHLSDINKKPSQSTMDKIADPDILIIPVGDNEKYLNTKEANAIIGELEPKIIIPMAYKCDSDPTAKGLEDFIKEIGLAPKTTDKKVIIKQKDLPQDRMELIVLEKSV